MTITCRPCGFGFAAAEVAAVAENDQGILEIGNFRTLGAGAEGELDLAKHRGPGSTLSR